MAWLKLIAVQSIVLAGVMSAAAEIIEIRLDPAEPFAEGKAFGSAGSYVRIKGVARGELDPDDPANRGIVDLKSAPRLSNGRVEYETDFFILRPADAARGNGVLLYEVTNRGRKFLMHWVNDAKSQTPAINNPRTIEHAGNGFLMQRGFTMVWSGWDPDAPKSGANLLLQAPIATENGKPIVQRIRHEFQIGTRGGGDGRKVALPYPAVSTDARAARLTERTRESEVRVEIPANRWSFVDRTTIGLTGEGAKFDPIKIYELWYEAQDPKVVGIGFAATRDLVAFLRHAPADKKGTINPVLRSGRPGTGISHALAIGISQSGRYLRHHLDLGMNADVSGRRVFDGMLVHISGAGKVFANHRFAMPNRTATQHEDRFYPENWFPFGYHMARDPASGRDGRLLSGTAADPKIIEINTSTEYWQKSASLVHTDPDGRRDARLPANVRVYLAAGTQHGGRIGLDSNPGPCALPRNPHNPSPLLRALLVALEQWVTDDRLPPASRVPRIADSTAVQAKTLPFPRLKGVAPPADLNPPFKPVDWIDPPAKIERPYAALVPAVDRDGNEVAGVRLPPIAVPLGTYTGWNYYAAIPSELCDRDGTYLPFAKTKAEREAAGDPRLSLGERYRTRETYVARVKAVSDALVRLRLLLPQDGEAYVAEARNVTF
jgi:hypothetical protein